MDNADYLIGEVLKEGLLGDTARAVGIGMMGKAAFNVTRKALNSPTAHRLAGAAVKAAPHVAAAVGRGIVKAAPIAAAAAPFVAAGYAIRKADKSSSRA